MKSSLFRKILKEDVIEVNKSVRDTIQCLEEQSGICREEISDDIRLEFNCSKKGKLSVFYAYNDIRRNYGLARAIDKSLCQYTVAGQVMEENNKTVVKITSVYRKTGLLKNIVIIIFALIFSVFYILSSFVCFNLYAFLIPIGLASTMIMIYIINTRKLHMKKKENIELMECVVKKRVVNVNHWDD